jgi:hypothetical protein
VVTSVHIRNERPLDQQGTQTMNLHQKIRSIGIRVVAPTAVAFLAVALSAPVKWY